MPGSDPIRHQTLLGASSRTFQRHHHAFAHIRMRTQSRLDFTQFNAETTDLDLMIVTSHILDCAVGTPTPKIAAAVHPCIGCIGERIGNKARGGQVLAIQISTCHTLATDIQLAHHPDRHRRTMSIEDVGTRIGDRTTNRTTTTPVHIGHGERPPRHMHRGFRNPVHIDQMRRQVALTLEPRLQGRDVQCFATKDDHPQTMLRTAGALRGNE